MTHFLHTQDDLQAGLAQLILIDPRLMPVAEKAGAFALRRSDAGYRGLCSIVCGQQLSTASAAAIRTRLFMAFDPPSRPATSRCRKPRASPSASRNGPTPRRSPKWPKPGVPGAAWRRICCGPSIMW